MSSSPIAISEQSVNEQASHQVSFLFSKIGVVILLAGFLLAVWFNLNLIAIILGLMFAIVGITQVWSSAAIRRLTCKRTLNTHRIFPGEAVDIKLAITNRKPLPLPWAEIDEEIPLKLAKDMSLGSGTRLGYGLHNLACSMLWYSETAWEYRLTGTTRGYYTLWPATLTTGDIFGIHPRTITATPEDHIIVYPTMYPILKFSIPSLYPVGDMRYERKIFEDPTRIMGIRDYAPHDSPRRIHWKSSARTGELKVKVFEPTTTLETALFLSVDSFTYTMEDDDATFELGVSTAASIARYLIDQGSQTGLFANTHSAVTGDSIHLHGGSSESQLIEILESLAKTTHRSSSPFIDFLQSERRTLPWGTTLVIIISKPDEELLALLAHLKENGYRLVIIQVGKTNARPVTTLPLLEIKSPADLVNLIVGDGL